MDLVFEICEALILCGYEGFEYFSYWHFAFTYCYLAFFALNIFEIFHVDIEEARANFFDGLHYVGAGAGGVANIDAAADARIHSLHRL